MFHHQQKWGRGTILGYIVEFRVTVVLEIAILKAKLSPVKSITSDLHIHGYKPDVDYNSPRYYYGTDLELINELSEERKTWTEKISDHFPNIKAEIIWSIRNEMCMTVEDFLEKWTGQT